MSLQDSSAPHTVRGYGVNIQSFEVLAREHISGSRLMVVVRSKVRPRTLHRRVRVGHVGSFRPPPATRYLHVLRPKLRMQTLQSAYRQGRKLVPLHPSRVRAVLFFRTMARSSMTTGSSWKSSKAKKSWKPAVPSAPSSLWRMKTRRRISSTRPLRTKKRRTPLPVMKG